MEADEILLERVAERVVVAEIASVEEAPVMETAACEGCAVTELGGGGKAVRFTKTNPSMEVSLNQQNQGLSL